MVQAAAQWNEEPPARQAIHPCTSIAVGIPYVFTYVLNHSMDLTIPNYTVDRQVMSALFMANFTEITGLVE